MKHHELIKEIRRLEKETTLPQHKLAFLTNVTFDQITPFLKYAMFSVGFYPEIFLGDYDNVFQDVLNEDSEFYKYNADTIILAMKLETLSKQLSLQFYSLGADAVQVEILRVIGAIKEIIRAIRRNCTTPILLHNFEVPINPGFGILDYQKCNAKINIVRNLNRQLLDVCQEFSGIYIVDVDYLQSMIGFREFFDARYWHIGKGPYTYTAYKALSNEYVKFVRALKGLSKKCLVLDCDNTLWGGVIGEDGIENILLGDTFPGVTFKEFQYAILDLYNKGIILGICSKNNEQDVLDVLENHPDMILRKKHFSIMKINWQDKITNLKEIANELNVGTDSLVMVDDSEFEINAIKKLAPEIGTLLLPRDSLLFRDMLLSSNFFDTVVLSDEDKKRTEMYQAQTERTKAQAEFNNVEDYLRFLEMEVFVKKANLFSISRVAQLTQKTNQFNLTTQRYSQTEIKEFVESNDYEVYTLSVNDKFGENGIVGAAIVKFEADAAILDTFLLSCRIIGRGVEKVLLGVCVDCAAKRSNILRGIYVPTKKNKQVENFFLNSSFTFVNQIDSSFIYEVEPHVGLIEIPDYFKVMSGPHVTYKRRNKWNKS